MVQAQDVRQITYVQAVNEAIRQEMERDPAVFVMGEDIAGAPGRDGEFATEQELSALDDEAGATVEESVRFADESPFPEPEDLLTDVYLSYPEQRLTAAAAAGSIDDALEGASRFDQGGRSG